MCAGSFAYVVLQIAEEIGFTTWEEFTIIVVEVLGEELGITGVDVTFEKIDGRWELLFTLRIPFGFDQPPMLAIDYAASDYSDSENRFADARIDADIKVQSPRRCARAAMLLDMPARSE